jgi:hypothetical protein
MWEYERKDYKFRFDFDLIKFLNEKGKENWEIIYYKEELPEKYGIELTAKILFKRQLFLQHNQNKRVNIATYLTHLRKIFKKT